MPKLALAFRCLILGSTLIAVPAVAVPITTLFSTGVDGSGLALPDYAVDPNYTLVASPGFPVAPAIVVGAPDLPVTWAANTATSRWINPDGVGGLVVDWHPGGTYVYETTFDLTGFDPSTVEIALAWAADDASVPGTDYIAINGIPLPPGGGGSGVGPDPGSYAGLHLKLIDAAVTPFFLPGLNTLSFVTGNEDSAGDPFSAPYSGPTGVHVKILAADADLVPEPSTAPLVIAGLVGLAGRRRASA
jgi:hypothetical protein